MEIDLNADNLPGIELLMNDKKPKTEKENNSEPKSVLELENELNNLVPETQDKNIEPEPITIDLDNIAEPINLGEETLKMEKEESYNGYKSFQNVKLEEEKNNKPQSKEDILREKFIYLKKLEELERKGIPLTQKYSMESDLNEMKGEYEMLKSEKEKIIEKFQAKMLMACAQIEFLNNKFIHLT